MYKGIDIRYATRPTADDAALSELRHQLREEEDRHQTLKFKLKFLSERLQAALDAGRADNAMQAADLFARLKEDLTIRFRNIVDLNREIASLTGWANTPQQPEPARTTPDADDALIRRVLSRINEITQPHGQPC